jgi:PAS domain S-box-containing protein
MEYKSDHTILVVNDVPVQVDLMSLQLRTAGYVAYSARDGREGYEIAREMRPELVISDVYMPRLNGIELCRSIRADPELSTTPIMLVSALRKDDASVAEGLNAGADDYLEAPYSAARLIAKAARLIERSQVEAHYRDIVEHASDIIYTNDLSGQLTSINAAGISFFGRSREELISSHIGEVLQLSKPGEWLRGALEELERAGELRDSFELTRGKSQRRWLELALSLVRDRNGRTAGVRGIARDITERRLADEKAKILNETLERRVMDRTIQLEEANKELEAFAYSVSHDLRTPLRFIGNLADMLYRRSAPILDEKNLRCLELISGEIGKVVNIIDDLREFSRVGSQEMRRAVVSLNEIVHDVKRDLQPEVDGREINWKIQSLPEVYGDPFMLRCAMQNLLSNAVKYTRPRSEAQIEIASTTTDGELIFYVRDNGVGFDMSLVDKLFGVFQRLHSAEEFEGTGIGLANVRRMIDRHGGRTWAEGHLGTGATFFFSLPKTSARYSGDKPGSEKMELTSV